MKAPEFNSSLRNSYQKLQQHFHETNTSQNALSAIGLALLNKSLKKSKEQLITTIIITITIIIIIIIIIQLFIF